MLKINKLPFLLIIAVITLSTLNCGGIKPANTSKAAKYVEDFFLGDGKMQYFVKALDYTNTNNEDASLDATFRRQDQKNDSVTVNFSVLLKSNNYINKVIITTTESQFSTEEVTTFFTEKDEDKIKHRASIKMPYSDYFKHLLRQNHTIEVTSEDDSMTIIPTKKSNQKFEPIMALLDDLL